MAFGIFTDTRNRHDHLVTERDTHSQQKPNEVPPRRAPAPRQGWRRPPSYSVSVDFPALDISRQWKRTTRGHFLALSIVSSRFVHAVACRRLFLSHGRVGPRRVNGPRFAYPVTHPCRTPGRFRPPRRSARGNSSI